MSTTGRISVDADDRLDVVNKNRRSQDAYEEEGGDLSEDRGAIGAAVLKSFWGWNGFLRPRDYPNGGA